MEKCCKKIGLSKVDFEVQEQRSKRFKVVANPASSRSVEKRMKKTKAIHTEMIRYGERDF